MRDKMTARRVAHAGHTLAVTVGDKSERPPIPGWGRWPQCEPKSRSIYKLAVVHLAPPPNFVKPVFAFDMVFPASGFADVVQIREAIVGFAVQV